jgi:hypothetical protein
MQLDRSAELQLHGSSVVAPLWRYECRTRCSQGQLCSARPGLKHFLTRFLYARTKNMPQWTQSPMPGCEQGISVVDHRQAVYNYTLPLGAGGHKKALVFPLTGHISLRSALLGAGLIRAIRRFLRVYSGAIAVQDDAGRKPPHRGNRANRLTPHILLLLCIHEH